MSAMIILVAAIVLAASTALVQHAGGGEEEDDVPLAVAPDKFEAGFYNKIQGLINEDASPAATNLRGNPDRNQKRAAADVSATYYHVIIQVSGDDREELRLNKASVVDILKAVGARDIVPANVLSFVTASVPAMEIPGLSLFGEVYGLGDGGIPPVSQMDISRRTIRATTADLTGLSDNVIDGSGVTMAIIDFGINHISLNSKVDARIYCPTGSCEIDGGNNTSTLSDDQLNALLSHSSTHGTVVSSVVAASGLSANNGISPGVRLLDGLSLSRGDMVTALDWALTNGADIAQISLIFSEPTTCISGYILNKAINQAVSEGMVVVSGAGNDGSSEGAFEYHTVKEPSCAQNAISVGGINSRSTPPILYRASSLGPVSDTIPRLVPHLVAPAVAITLWSSSVSSSSFKLFFGTSFAAPMVSAAAAMVLQLNPDLDPAETKSLLLLGTDWTGPVPCTSTQYETTDSSDHCSHAARRDYGATSTLETLNHVGFGVLDVAKSIGYAVNSSSHIVSDNFDSSSRSVLYGLNVTEPLAQTKVLLTWLVPFIFNHNDANFDFTITCPGLDTIRAESDHQTVEFAVFEPAEAGVCAVQVVAKTGSQDFTLASTYPLGPPPSEFVESDIVVSAEDGTYTLNETIVITAEFPRAVKVEGTSKPYLELDVAPTARHAVYTDISANGTVLSFEYVVQDDDATTDLSYTSTDALVVPDGGNLTDAQTGIPVRPVLPAPGEAGSLSAARDIVVTTVVTDTTAPTVSSIERYSPSSATTDSQTLVYEVTFSEDVTGVDKADFALSPGSTGVTSTSSGQFTQTRSPSLAIPDNTTVSDAITVADSGTATSVTVAVDITHTYIGDLKIDLVAPDGTTKTVHNRSGGGTDNINQEYTPNFDGVPIAGTWILRIRDNANFDSGTLNDWTLTISHGSGTTTNPVTSVSGSGDKYYTTVSSTQDGTYNLDLVLSGHGIADTASNLLTNTAPTGADETYTVSTVVTDTTAPTVSSIERYNPSSATTDSQTLAYRITFSEDVTGVDKADFALSPGSTGGTSTSSGQFTQTRSPSLAIPDNTTVSDAITVADSGTATSVTVAVDITHTYIGDLKIDLVAPDGTTKTVHNRSGGGTDNINQEYTPDFEGESIAGTWTLRIRDNANSDSGTLNDWTLTISHGSGTTTNPVTSVSGSGDTYYATVSSTQDGTYNLDLVLSGHGIADTASNPLANTAPTGADETYTVSTVVTDTTAPTVSSIERYNPSSATTDSQTLAYRITFSEDVTGVDKADFALSPGSTGGTSTSSGQFTQTRSPALAITQANTIYDTITVSDSGTATSVSVAVDVTHTYIGDLKIDLVAPDGTTKTVHSRSGGGTDNINQEYTPDFEGESIAGTWTLRINDNYAAADNGILNSWTLTINHGSGTTTNPVTSVSGSGDTYYATVSSTQDGTYNLDLVLSGHGIADTASNPLANTAPTGADETYTVSTVVTDSTAPTVSSIERYSPSSATTGSQTLVYRITFSEDVTGVGTADFALSPGSTGGTSTSSGQFTQTRSPALAITQANTISDTITVSDSGTATSVSVAVDVTHTYIGDLKIDLVAPDGTTKTVHSRSGGGTDNINQEYTPDFEGESIAGTWTLRINDNYAAADNGILNSWTLTINHGSGTTTNSVTSVSGSDDTYYATVSSTQAGTYNLDLVLSGHGIADTASNPLANTTPTGADETYTFSTAVTDSTAPTVSSIERYNPSSATTDSQTLVYRITFSEDVTGVGTADFALSSDSTGNTNGNNPVTSVSGSSDTYYATVSSTQDGTYNLDLVPSGHGIADTASNPLANTTPTGADETYTVSTTITDTTAPTISSIERYNPSSATTDSQTLTYKVTFSEDVSGVDKSDFALSSSSTGGAGGGGTSEQFTQTRSPSLAITQANTISDTITVSDSGTATSVSVAVDVTHTYIGDLKIDLVAPDGTTKTVHSRSGGGTDDINQTYTPDFEGESIAGTWTLRINDNYAAADNGILNSWTLTINHGDSTASPVTSISGSGDTYYVIASSAVDGTYNLDLVSSGHNIVDESSNPLANTTPTGADETYTFSTTVTDSTAPTVSSIERYSPSGATTDSQTLVYRITFSEDVTGVDTDDFALSSDSTGETNGNNPVTSISGSGSVYYATVSATTDGTYNLDLVSSGHGIADTASNPLTNTAPTGADETYTVSTTVVNTINPRLESIERYSPASQNTNSQYLIYKATFSKSVTGVGASDFVLSPGSTGGGNNGISPVAGITGSGYTYYVIVSSAVDGTYNLDLVSSGHNIADAASNPLTNTAPTGADQTYTVS